MQEPTFFQDTLQTSDNHGTMQIYESYVRLNVLARGQIEWDLTMRKKIHLLSTCCSFEKNSRLFTIFPDLMSIFQTFPKIQKFQKCKTNPVIIFAYKSDCLGTTSSYILLISF